MANRYVGARYVPLIMGDWNSANAYEALSVVMYQGDSYISKVPVPANIQISNTTYWAKCADYNAQWAAFQQNWTEFQQDIEDELDQNTADLVKEIQAYNGVNIIPAGTTPAYVTVNELQASTVEKELFSFPISLIKDYLPVVDSLTGGDPLTVNNPYLVIDTSCSDRIEQFSRQFIPLPFVVYSGDGKVYSRKTANLTQVEDVAATAWASANIELVSIDIYGAGYIQHAFGKLELVNTATNNMSLKFVRTGAIPHGYSINMDGTTTQAMTETIRVVGAKIVTKK